MITKISEVRNIIIYPYLIAKETEVWRVSVAYPRSSRWSQGCHSQSICLWCWTFGFKTLTLTSSTPQALAHQRECLSVPCLAHGTCPCATHTSLALGLTLNPMFSLTTHEGLTTHYCLPWGISGLARTLAPLCFHVGVNGITIDSDVPVYGCQSCTFPITNAMMLCC